MEYFAQEQLNIDVLNSVAELIKIFDRPKFKIAISD